MALTSTNAIRDDLARTTQRTDMNPTKLDKPSFLLNVPFSLATGQANNIWMEEMSEKERSLNMRKAMRQFLEVYHFMAAESIVYLLPTPRNCALQDLVYTGNLGAVLEHRPDKNTVVLSNFTSEPRTGEEMVGEAFFEMLGYDTYICPFKFEGEAELKHLHDNVYVGGYGTRSERKAYDWMEKQFDARIVKIEETDPYLYHLDCTVFPLTREDTLFCTEMYTEEEVKEVEKHTNIIDVSIDDCLSGITNSVRVSNTILNASHIHDLKAGTSDYDSERDKNGKLQKLAVNQGFEVAFFNLSEFMKSGALLSCMVMHLNRKSYDFALL